MTEQGDGRDRGISDEELPEELQPSEENPLAQPLTEEDDPKSPEELDVLGGKAPEQGGEESQGEDETDDSSESDA